MVPVYLYILNIRYYNINSLGVNNIFKRLILGKHLSFEVLVFGPGIEQFNDCLFTFLVQFSCLQKIDQETLLDLALVRRLTVGASTWVKEALHQRFSFLKVSLFFPIIVVEFVEDKDRPDQNFAMPLLSLDYKLESLQEQIDARAKDESVCDSNLSFEQSLFVLLVLNLVPARSVVSLEKQIVNEL